MYYGLMGTKNNNYSLTSKQLNINYQINEMGQADNSV